MNEPTLKKQLNPMHVWAIAFGCIIGWGSFINPGKKFLPNSGVAGITIAMILGALVMVIIAFSYAYMIPKYPKAGGDFSCGENQMKLIKAVADKLMDSSNLLKNASSVMNSIEGIFTTDCPQFLITSLI